MKERLAQARPRWRLLTLYEAFEQGVILVLTALIALVVPFALWNLTVKILGSILPDFDPSDYQVFQAIFGMIFTLIVALECKRSLLVVAARSRSVVQVRTVVLLARLARDSPEAADYRPVGDRWPAAVCAYGGDPRTRNRVLAQLRSGQARSRKARSR
jgi:hypothetical protein